MKINLFVLAFSVVLFLLNCRMMTPGPSPKMTVLFIIDGMACGTLERLNLPTLQMMRDRGVYFPSLHLPLPAHLVRNDSVGSSHYYPWGCSLPNIILQTGSLFVGASGLKESMIQHSFPKGTTAFIVNDDAYEELRYGFSFYLRYGKSEKDQYDYAGLLGQAQQIIIKHQPRFFRIHLQGTGSAGYLDQQAGRGLWSDCSLYCKEMVRADSALTGFISWLEENKCYEQAAFIVMGDHGQNDEGWHAPYVGQAHQQPVLFFGAGIKKKRVYTNASSLDIAPTICHINQVKPPTQNMGRVLLEVCDGEAEPEYGMSLVARLNDTLLQHHRLMAQIPLSSQSKEFIRVNESFLTIETIGSWHRHFNTIEELVNQEEQVLADMQSRIKNFHIK